MCSNRIESTSRSCCTVGKPWRRMDGEDATLKKVATGWLPRIWLAQVQQLQTRTLQHLQFIPILLLNGKVRQGILRPIFFSSSIQICTASPRLCVSSAKLMPLPRFRGPSRSMQRRLLNVPRNSREQGVCLFKTSNTSSAAPV